MIKDTSFSFEGLRVYQEALLFTDWIYLITKQFPKAEMFGLTDQLRRACVSIILNIAEGSSRTKRDFRHFLTLSRGSCYECLAVLTIAKRQKYILKDDYNVGYEYCNKIARMLSALRSSIK